MGLCALLLPLWAVAAQRVEFLIPGPPACDAPPSTFRKTMAVLAPDALVVQRCYAEFDDLPALARKIVSTMPDVVVVYGQSPAARALKDVAGRIPLVFVDLADPVGNGLVESLARPGTNATGIANMAEELVAKRLELLREVLPGLTRVALLGNVSVPLQVEYERRAQAAASQLKMKAILYAVTARTQLADAFQQMERDGVQAVVLLPDAWFYPSRSEIVALAGAHRLPAMYRNTDYAIAGGLLVYAPDLPAMSERAAGYVVRILKGAKPGELPVEGPTKLQFIVN